MKNIAIIPARSGSKGLPKKNIKELCGKPLLAYSIEAAIHSEMFEVVHVSTDSEQYANIAKKYGADVPFLRSEQTASDTASTWDTVFEVLEKYRAMGKNFDTVTVLQPTSPLRMAEDIQNAFKLFAKKNAKTVVSVCECEHSPKLSNRLSEDFCMRNFILPSDNKRRQDSETYYRLNGAIYTLATDCFLEHRCILYNENTYAYVMPQERSTDIDTILDFIIIESILKYYHM